MKKFDVTFYEDNKEVYDCDIIEANDDNEAMSVAQDILYNAGYTFDEIVKLTFTIKEME